MKLKQQASLKNLKLSRRKMLAALGLTGITGLTGCKYWPDDTILNQCQSPVLPEHLQEHPVIVKAWQGIDPAQLWDTHVHLIGTGDSDSGVWITPRMASWRHPIEHLQYRFYLNASCISDDERVDEGFVERLSELMDAMPVGAKAMLLAFDYNHNDAGEPDAAHSTFHTPNAYAARIASSRPDRFEWVASIHPYIDDKGKDSQGSAVDRLYQAVELGARAVKWLPPAMGIDPSDPRCEPFYRAMKDLGIPLITHAGDEKAVHSAEAQAMGNPLRLEYALECGVKVIVAHCASLGQGTVPFDDPQGRKVENFELFCGMMENQDYTGLLFGEISATTQVNRRPEVLQTLLSRRHWQTRLLNASDYPLPGIPVLFSLRHLRDQGFLGEEEVAVLNEVRRHNALLFDFLVKRCLRFRGESYDDQVFHTRRHFETAHT